MLLANYFAAPKGTNTNRFGMKKNQYLFVSTPVFVQFRVRQQHPFHDEEPIGEIDFGSLGIQGVHPDMVMR